MRTKEMTEYLLKKRRILDSLKESNIDEITSSYLNSLYEKENENEVIYLSEMVKNLIFNYKMYGKEEVIERLQNNEYYLFNGSKEREYVKKEIKQLFYLLNCNSVNDINNTVINIADNVSLLMNKECQNCNKYVYAAQ